MSVYVKVQKPSINSIKRNKRGKLENGVDIEIEKALKKFKKKVKDSKLLKIYHEKMYFIKPSEKKRAQRLMAIYRTRKQTIENRDQ